MESKKNSLHQFGKYFKLSVKRLSVNILCSILLIHFCFCNVENPQSKNNKKTFSVFAFFAYNEKSSIITTQVGSMNNIHFSPRAILLDTGKVLVVGNGAELFDPSTLSFSVVPNRTLQRVYHTLTKLQDGRVLISGDISTVEIYDPTSTTFSNTGSMIQSLRTGHTTTLLSNGKVLFAGGYLASSFSTLRSAELYDPITGTFTLTGNMNYARDGHNATLLNDGTVLIIGGFDSRSKNLTTVEIYNPTTGTFTSVSNSSCQSSSHGSSALLSNKNVFIADNASGSTSTIQVYNLSSSNCSVIQQSLRGISDFSTTLLKDGRVLLVGGQIANYYVRELNVYDPTSNTLSNLGNMNQYRYTVSIVLQDGRVLLMGGTPSATSKIAEIYTPSGTPQ